MSGSGEHDNQNLAHRAKNGESFGSEQRGGLVDRLFLAHPRSVGETYRQHQGVAWSVAGELLAAGVAALVHGLIPSMFERTGSQAIKRLHDRVILKRPPSDA